MCASLVRGNAFWNSRKWELTELSSSSASDIMDSLSSIEVDECRPKERPEFEAASIGEGEYMVTCSKR